MKRLTIALAVLAASAAAHGPAGTGQVPATPAEAPFSAAERSLTIAQLADALAALYLRPDTGRRYAATLRTNLAEGAYDGLSDQKAFADKVTADLQAVSPDGHLRLLPNAAFQHPPETDGPKSGFPEGIEEMRMIGRVAYLRFNAFPHDPRTAPAARAFLLARADARAVILDARPLPGGGIEVMDAILPLFYARRTILLSLDTRAAADAESPFADGPTLVRRQGPAGYVTRDHIVTPDPAETRLMQVPLFYLTSSRTASAGEHLALALKSTGRATLVGETTRGAAHYGALVPVGSRLTAFLPVGRGYDPATGWDWQGKGVAPHVAVPAARALDEALRRAR
jgi:hypothetical protein